jgi:hypothetical protein
VSLFLAKRFIVFSHGFLIGARHGIAIDGLEGIRIFVACELLGDPSTSVVEGSNDAIINDTPLWLRSVPSKLRPDTLRFFASLRKSLANIRLIHEFLDRTEPLGPVVEASASERRLVSRIT